MITQAVAVDIAHLLVVVVLMPLTVLVPLFLIKMYTFK